MKPLRRSSSNGVRDLLAIFESGSSTTTASTTSTTTRGPTTRRVTATFVPVELAGFTVENGVTSKSTSAMSAADMSAAVKFGPYVERTACLDLTLQQYLDQDSTKYHEVIIAAAVLRRDPDSKPVVLLMEPSDNKEHFELVSSRIMEEDGSILEALIRTVVASTGMMVQEIVARIPDTEYAKQGTILLDNGSQQVDAEPAVQITYLITVPALDPAQVGGKYARSLWATLEDVQKLEISEPMGKAVQSAFEFSKSFGAGADWNDMVTEERSKDQKVGAISSSSEPVQENIARSRNMENRNDEGIHENSDNNKRAEASFVAPPTLETAGQYDGFPDQHGGGSTGSVFDAVSPDGKGIALASRDIKGEYTEKKGSAVEDEEARLLPADPKATATLANVQTNISNEEQEEELNMAQSSVEELSHAPNGIATTNGHIISNNSQPTSSTPRLSNLSTANRPTKSSSSKASIPKLSSKLNEVPKPKAPNSTITNGKTRGLDQATSKQPATENTLRKAKSPSRSVRVTSNVFAPTASSSARTENSSVVTRTAPTRTWKPIEGTPHFLSSTAASAAKKDLHHVSESIKHAEPTKRDRTSIASTSNGTSRKPNTTQYRNSLQPSNGTTTRPMEPRVSTSSKDPKVANGDFLARMTRPTAASSGKSLEKAEVKSTDQYGSIRGKLGGAVNGTVSKRSGAAVASATRQVSATLKLNAHGSTGTARGRSNPTATSINGRKEQNKVSEAPLTTTSSIPSLQASPDERRVDVDEADIERDAVPGTREDGSSVNDEPEGEEGAIQAADDMVPSDGDDEPGTSGLESRMMQSLELGGDGVGVIH